MAQNIYDDPEFFRGYSGLPRSVEGLGAAAEWPWMQALLPPFFWVAQAINGRD